MQGQLPVDVSKTKLVIPPANLPSSGVLTIIAHMTRDGASADAVINVPLNAKPAVIAPLSVTSIDNSFPDSSFGVSAAASFHDEDTLR